MSNTNYMEQREILTAEEAAEYLRMKKSTLQQKVRKGEIPFTPLGEKTVVFVKRFLDLWLAMVTKGGMASRILALELAHYARPLLPGSLLPLSQNTLAQIARSEEDIKAGRISKLAD